MKDIEGALTKAAAECEQLAMRFTDKRSNVLKLLLQATEPLSAYVISAQYQAVFAVSLSPVSVYRMLDFLLQAGLVHKLETTNQYVACAHIVCEHVHEVPQFLICDTCHAVEEVGLPESLLRELQDSIGQTGFALRSQQLELHGLCAKCQDAEEISIEG